MPYLLITDPTPAERLAWAEDFRLRMQARAEQFSRHIRRLMIAGCAGDANREWDRWYAAVESTGRPGLSGTLGWLVLRDERLAHEMNDHHDLCDVWCRVGLCDHLV